MTDVINNVPRDDFQREERYVVVKISKMHPHPEFRRQHLAALKAENSAALVDCLVIEKDWPEYEAAWSMIEARISGATAQPAADGEREAFDIWFRRVKGLNDAVDTTFISEAFFPFKAFKFGIECGRAPQPAPAQDVAGIPACFSKLLHHAHGMTMGIDWNKGTHAGFHRSPLGEAVVQCQTWIAANEQNGVKS